MRTVLALLPWLRLLVVVAIGALIVRDLAARHPEHLPWTPLDLTAPIGWSTAGKLAALKRDLPRCRALLAAAGVAVKPVTDRPREWQCAVAGAVRVDALGLPLQPGGLTLSCPMAATLVMWTREIVRPAARARLGTQATGLVNYGSYNCRRIAGSNRLSEHATANAIDIAGVRLAGVREIMVARDWRGSGDRAAFLRDLHDGACRLFAVVLSPDYNAAHRDHLHLDQGPLNTCR